MRILLVGEYSRLHNTLKEGLQELGHEVVLIGTGDGFKGFPVDIDYSARYFTKRWLRPFVKALAKLTTINLIKFENAICFNEIVPQLKDFDIVQLINESPIKTYSYLEIRLLKKLFRQNKKIFLLSCGVDYMSVKYAMDKHFRYSILTPLHENATLKKHYQFVLRNLSRSHEKLHHFLFERVNGVISSDIDYHLPLEKNEHYLGLIPNPINTDNISYINLDPSDKIIIFHGINMMNYIKKGNRFFEDALAIIQDKYPNKVEIITTKNIPYKEYINLYNKAHIVLDQVYAYDQGYNALEAMAKGKVVFTGAEQEWLDHYQIEEDTIAINALPDVDYLVKKLEWLILNPNQITYISKNARNFIERKHHYITNAKIYLETWKIN